VHPATKEVLRFFGSKHLQPGRKAGVAKRCEQLACEMAEFLPEHPQVTIGLQKLLEAKDCFVRAELTRDDPEGLAVSIPETQ
jgi:hypothetical protein